MGCAKGGELCPAEATRVMRENSVEGDVDGSLEEGPTELRCSRPSSRNSVQFQQKVQLHLSKSLLQCAGRIKARG